MRFDLSKEIDVIRFRAKAEYHIRKQTKKLDLTEKRTVRQNSYLHLILGWFAIESSTKLDYVKLHYFKKLVNPAIFTVAKKDKFLGHVETVRSSADLTTAEMATAITRFRNWSSEEGGIYLPEAHEKAFLEHIQNAMDNYKEWI